jgi:subtilisin family serine protease
MKKRYVVLPGKGISGPAMQASIFQRGEGRMLASAMEHGLSQIWGDSPNARVAKAAPAPVELASVVQHEDFSVLSQRFADGPAVVAMTDAARLAFEASYPGLRVLPITRYHLPGRGPRRKKSDPASVVAAGESAVAADGTVFAADAKQHFLSGAAASIGASGNGVTIGVVDTGVDNTHPALTAGVSALRCYVPGAAATAGGPVDWGEASKPRSGHGTHVAGIIAARPGFGGPPGVAPDATLVSYRVFPDNPTGPKGAENAVIIDSIRAAIDDGCHILNLSIEGPGLREDGVRTAISDAWNQGVICVAAAGNGFGNPVSYPAALAHCVAVTAVGRDGAFPNTPAFLQHVSNQRAAVDPEIFLASFSNFGPRVQFTAPGHAIVSTFPGGAWWFDSGTSMAAPFITGMLARLLSANTNILNMIGGPERSAAMMQMLIGRAKVLRLPQVAQEGYGLPV